MRGSDGTEQRSSLAAVAMNASQIQYYRAEQVLPDASVVEVLQEVAATDRRVLHVDLQDVVGAQEVHSHVVHLALDAHLERDRTSPYVKLAACLEHERRTDRSLTCRSSA